MFTDQRPIPEELTPHPGADRLVFSAHIAVWDGKYHNGNIIEEYKWEGYKLDQFMKWEWYFRYRACLLQIKYPKNLVRFVKIRKEEKDNFKILQEDIQHLKNRISAKKGVITKVTKALTWYELKQKELLIPDYTDETYLFGKSKLTKNKIELQELIIKREELEQKLQENEQQKTQ